MSSPRAAASSLAGPPAERGGDRRHGDAGDEQPGGEDDRRRGQERGRDRDRDGAGDERDQRRPDAAEVEVLQRVDVGDDPREQVAAPVALELGGRERLDALVDAHARPAEDAEREVVRGEPLEVTRERPRQPEEADARRSRP